MIIVIKNHILLLGDGVVEIVRGSVDGVLDMFERPIEHGEYVFKNIECYEMGKVLGFSGMGIHVVVSWNRAEGWIAGGSDVVWNPVECIKTRV